MSLPKNHNLKYLVVNEIDESWGLVVTTIGFQAIPKGTTYPPKGHPSSYWFNPDKGRTLHEFQIIYITKGEGVFQSAHYKSTKVTAGMLFVLFPEEWHTYRPAKNIGWEVYWLGLNGKNMLDLLSNNFFSRSNPIIDIGFNEQMVALYKQGIEIANFQKTAYQQMLAGLTHHLLSFIFYSEKNNSFRDKEIISQIDRARMIMRDNAYNNKSPEEIAMELNISYSWFRRVFKQYTGFSPVQYQMEIKVQKAKELLTSTAMQIKEICYELDFESVSYFVTFFKSKVGVSPTKYRLRVHAKSKVK